MFEDSFGSNGARILRSWSQTDYSSEERVFLGGINKIPLKYPNGWAATQEKNLNTITYTPHEEVTKSQP